MIEIESKKINMKLSKLDREIIRFLGRALDTAIRYGDEINYIVRTEIASERRWTYPYQEKDDDFSEKRLENYENFAQVMDYVSNCPLNEIFKSSKQKRDFLESSGKNTLDLTISVKTPEGIKDFILVREECSHLLSENITFFDNNIMSYLFFRENFSDSLLKSDIEDFNEEQFINALIDCPDEYFSFSTDLATKIFLAFKRTVISKNIMKQEDALNFVFASTERGLFNKLYKDKTIDPWDVKNAKLPSEMDSCDYLPYCGGWFYWPCLDSDKED